MKKIIYSLVVVLMMFASCRKSDNPKVPALTRVPVPNLTKDATAGQAISALSPAASAAFAGKFTVDVKFPNDTKPSKMDVVVRKNGDNGNVKLFQANVTSYPTIISVAGSQLITMFGPIALGDQFDFGVDIYTQDGQKFEAFPLLGVPYGSGVPAEYGGVTTVISYSAICPYDASIYVGNFVVVQDDWQDTQPGDIILFTAIDATHFSFNYNPTNHAGTLIGSLPIIVKVDPLSNTPSITKQVIGTKWTYDPSPIQPTLRTLAGAANIVKPCDKTISLNLAWGEAGTEFGPAIFSLRKQ